MLEFMLGENIPVAPVVTQHTYERTVFFPEGKWKEADGTVYEGKSEKVLPTPIDTLLYFEKI